MQLTKIIGVDRNQFTQIAMIAQGDFMKLLLATTEERKKIFQKLFKTQSYYFLQEKLKSESGKLAEEYKVLKSSIEQYIGGIVCEEESACFDGVCNAKSGNLTTGEIAELLEKLISDDEASEKTVSEEKEKLQKELDGIKTRITKAEDILAAKKDFEKNEADFKEESEKETALKEKLEYEEKKLPEIKRITERVAEIKALLPDYDELSEKKTAYDKNKIFIRESSENTQKKEDEIKILAEETIALTEESKALEKIGEEKLKLETERKKKREEKEKSEKLNKDIKAAKKQRIIYGEAAASYVEKQKYAEMLDAELKEKTRIYLEAQAGILAETLEAGKPCPVCGSTSHPHSAAKPVDAPTVEELDILQIKLNNAGDDANNARAEAGKLKGASDEKEKSVKKEIALLLGEVSLEDAEEVIAVRVSAIASLMDELDKRLEEAQLKIERKKELDELIPEKSFALEKAKEELSELRDAVKTKAVENDALEKRIAELTKKLIFKTKSEAEIQITALNKEAGEIQRAYDEALKKVNDNKEKLASLKSAKEEILKRIGSDTDVDMEKEKENNKLLDEKLAELDEISKEIHSRKTSNKASLHNILKKLDEIKAVEEKWMWMKALSNTANGNLSGREKVMLETYIQTTYFDRIINRANSRLLIMSGGQYELKRRKEAENNRSQSGLELDVIDHYNGTERSVKTLSGGESFKASLSLALGLSDEIQSSAGGIRLDTMFVDEGFGSLDDESLSQAIRALLSLAEGNRIVGIISHVNELKERIDKQLIVRKEKTGGSNITVVV